MNLRNNKFKVITLFLFLITNQIFAKRFIKQPKKLYFQTQTDYDFTDPYLQVGAVLPFNNHGWYGNGRFIEKLMKLNKIHTVIEIGSWLGCSTRHIASLLQQHGKLYAVDTWQGSIEHLFTKELAVMLPTLYQQFLSNMIHARLTDIVIPVRMFSVQAAPILAQKLTKVDMVYLDGAHDTESVLADLNAYWPFVADNNGIMCGDDWKWETTALAISKFALLHGLTIYHGDNFWFFKKEDGYREESFKDISSNDIWIFTDLQ